MYQLRMLFSSADFRVGVPGRARFAQVSGLARISRLASHGSTMFVLARCICITTVSTTWTALSGSTRSVVLARMPSTYRGQSVNGASVGGAGLISLCGPSRSSWSSWSGPARRSSRASCCTRSWAGASRRPTLSWLRSSSHPLLVTWPLAPSDHCVQSARACGQPCQEWHQRVRVRSRACPPRGEEGGGGGPCHLSRDPQSLRYLQQWSSVVSRSPRNVATWTSLSQLL